VDLLLGRGDVGLRTWSTRSVSNARLTAGASCAGRRRTPREGRELDPYLMVGHAKPPIPVMLATPHCQKLVTAQATLWIGYVFTTTGMAWMTLTSERGPRDWGAAMSADWWDMYGSPEAQAAERRCWDCDSTLRMDAVSPDGVRCLDCWRARVQPGSKRRAPRTHPGGQARRDSRRRSRVRS